MKAEESRRVQKKVKENKRKQKKAAESRRKQQKVDRAEDINSNEAGESGSERSAGKTSPR